jgi:hypothetical protein
MNDMARIVNYAQQLIDRTSKNTKDSLDFIEGFVYALLLVQDKAKEIYAEKEKSREN